MRKITHYLMLLLCLMLLPHQVFALEEGLDTNNSTSNVVISENDEKEEKEEENLVELEEKNLVSLEEENLVELGKENLDQPEEKKEVEELENNNELNTLSETENLDGAETENLDGSGTENLDGTGTEQDLESAEKETEVQTTEGETDSLIYVEEISFSGVPSELIVGEAFPFGGETPEGAPYHYVSSAWNGYGISSSDNPSWNAIFQEEGHYSDKVLADMDYFLEIYVHLDDGYTFGEATDNYYDVNGENDGLYRTLKINGTEYDVTVVHDTNNDYWLYPNYSVSPFDPNAVYQEGLTLDNINETATEGQEPLFGAEVEEEHFKLATEVWYTYEYTYDDEGWLTDIHVYANYSDSSYQEDYEETFTVFSNEKLYSYAIIVVPDEGYRLKINVDENNYTTIPLTFNGKQQDVYVSTILDDNGKLMFYRMRVLEDVTPTTEQYSITEHADMIIDKSEGVDLAIKSDGAFSLFKNVYVDGKILDPEHYMTGDGETVVKFSNDYLQTLSTGTHEIALSFSDGKNAYTTVTITDVNNAEEEELPSDGTGSSAGVVESTAPATYTTDTVPTTITTTSENDNTLEPVDEEKIKDQETKKDDKDKEEKEEKKNKTGLWIALVVLLLIGIAIPVTIYRREEE